MGGCCSNRSGKTETEFPPYQQYPNSPMLQQNQTGQFLTPDQPSGVYQPRYSQQWQGGPAGYNVMGSPFSSPIISPRFQTNNIDIQQLKNKYLNNGEAQSEGNKKSQLNNISALRRQYIGDGAEKTTANSQNDMVSKYFGNETESDIQSKQQNNNIADDLRTKYLTK